MTNTALGPFAFDLCCGMKVLGTRPGSGCEMLWPWSYSACLQLPEATDAQGGTMLTYEDPELTKNATVVLTPCDGEMMVRCVKCIEMWIPFWSKVIDVWKAWGSGPFHRALWYHVPRSYHEHPDFRAQRQQLRYWKLILHAQCQSLCSRAIYTQWLWCH